MAGLRLPHLTCLPACCITLCATPLCAQASARNRLGAASIKACPFLADPKSNGPFVFSFPSRLHRRNPIFWIIHHADLTTKTSININLKQTMDAFTNKTSQPAPGAAAGQKDDYVDKGESFSLLNAPTSLPTAQTHLLGL